MERALRETTVARSTVTKVVAKLGSLAGSTPVVTMLPFSKLTSNYYLLLQMQR